MNTIDPQKAARVWQRVQGATRPSDRELLTMIAREWTDAATYLQLSRQFQGKDSANLRRLYDEEQAHTACLKGIYTLITGTRPNVKALALTGQDPEALLRRLYGRQMQGLADYEAKSQDPEYGPVFARLADQERDHCRTILEVIGNLKKR